jgi:hypothetical protein
MIHGNRWGTPRKSSSKESLYDAWCDDLLEEISAPSFEKGLDSRVLNLSAPLRRWPVGALTFRSQSAPTPIHEAVFANLRARRQPVLARVDLTDANEEWEDSDRQRNPLYGNRKTTAPPARNS